MKQIYLSKNGQQLGPFPEDQIIAGLQSGQYSPDTPCWHEGLAEWKPLSAVVTLPKPCKLCGGHGQVRMQRGFHSVQETCPRCHGTGGRPAPQPSVLSVLFVMHDGQQQGPFTEADIHERLQNGSLSSQDVAWKEGMAEWQPLAVVMPPTTSNPNRKFSSEFMAAFRTIWKDVFPSVPASTRTSSSKFTWQMKLGAVLGGVLGIWAMIHFNGSSSSSGSTTPPPGFNQGTSGPGISKANHNTPLENHVQLTEQNTFLYYFALSGAQMSNQVFESYVENHMGNRQNRPSKQDSFAWQAYLDSMRPQLRMQIEQVKQNRYIKFSATGYSSCPKSYDFNLKGFPFLGNMDSYDFPTGTMLYMKGVFVNPEKFAVLRIPEEQARVLSQKLGDRGCSHVDIYAYVAAAGDRDGRGALWLEPTQLHIKLSNGETFIYRPQ